LSRRSVVATAEKPGSEEKIQEVEVHGFLRVSEAEIAASAPIHITHAVPKIFSVAHGGVLSTGPKQEV